MTLYIDFLKKYGLPLELREQFADTLENLKGKKVDIVLGNHPAQNATMEKRRLMIESPGTNPFINPQEWDESLIKLSKQYCAFLQQDHEK